MHHVTTASKTPRIIDRVPHSSRSKGWGTDSLARNLTRQHSVRISAVLLIAVFLTTAKPASADINSIQAFLFTQEFDTTFDGTTFQVSTDPLGDVVTVSDGIPTLSRFFNVNFSLTATFAAPGDRNGLGHPQGRFRDGWISLTFEDDNGAYEIAGPVPALWMTVSATFPLLSRVDVEGCFDAQITDLPGSGIWPDMGLSDFGGLVFDIPADLDGYDWAQHPPWPSPAINTSNLQLRPLSGASKPRPCQVPEPTTLFILAILCPALLCCGIEVARDRRRPSP